MKTPTFNSTVDILVKAYLNDTLEHGDCKACAVGNMVRSAAYPLWEKDSGAWYDIVVCGNVSDQFEQLAKDQVIATGYSKKELKSIEKAFENADGDYDNFGDVIDTYHGLMAVVDVLAEIHNIDLSSKEEAKKLFVKI